MEGEGVGQSRKQQLSGSEGGAGLKKPQYRDIWMFEPRRSPKKQTLSSVTGSDFIDPSGRVLKKQEARPYGTRRTRWGDVG